MHIVSYPLGAGAKIGKLIATWAALGLPGKPFPLIFDPRAHGAWASGKTGSMGVKLLLKGISFFFFFPVVLHSEQDSLACDKGVLHRRVHTFCFFGPSGARSSFSLSSLGHFSCQLAPPMGILHC